MKYILQRLALGILLIAGAAAILLVSDGRRRNPERTRVPRVAIFQFSSRSILDDSVRGILDALAEQGWVPGKTLEVRKYNAENDLPTAHAIAKEIAGGGFDLAVTVSTPCLQVMAGANRKGAVVHVFGVVTDPFGAGVGINPANSLDRPAHLAGMGTFQPVKEVFRLAKQSFPALKSVGVVWCPLEACSEACLRLAREVCGELGLTLLEAQVDNTAGILEAADSLVERGVEALWIGGDNIVESAPSSVVQAARKGRIPVFANAPEHAAAGALIGLGADYYEVGRCEGTLAARILKGAKPAAERVENVVPQKLALNLGALENLRDPWHIPPEMRARAARVIDPAGVGAAPVAVPAAAIPAPAAGRVYQLGVAHFGPDPSTEDCIHGLRDGLKALGYESGKNLQVQVKHAQAEIVNLPQLIQALDNQGLDVLVPMTTPCLTAAIAAAKRTPIVFTSVYDPLAAGAGESFERHRPQLTGIASAPPLDQTFALIRKLCPGATKIGTLFNPSEANSSKAVRKGRELAAALGIRLEEVSINATSEILPAAQVLASRGVQAFWVTGDNTVLQALAGVVKVARDNKLPLFCNDVDFLDQGPLVSVGFSFYEAGRAAAAPAARVMSGESPAGIPIVNVARLRQGLNFQAASDLGIAFPPEVVEASAVFLHLRARLGRPGRVAVIASTRATEVAPLATELQRGLAGAGLVAGQDVVVEPAGTNLPAGVDILVAADAEGWEAIRRMGAAPVFNLAPGRGGPDAEAVRRCALEVARALAGAAALPRERPDVPGRTFKLGMAYFAPEPGCELAQRGLLDGLRALGIEEGRNLAVRRSHAQGDISLIPTLLQVLDNGDSDALAVFTTPVLSAACGTVKQKPVVFAYITDPVAAGAGRSLDDHLPGVTGIGSFPPMETVLEFMRQLVPGLARLGVIYNTSDASSSRIVSALRPLCPPAGVRLEEVVVNSTAEAADAIRALLDRGVQVVYVPSDNTAYQALDILVSATRAVRVPLVVDDAAFLDRGVTAAVGLSYYEAGAAAAELLARVLRGESPAALPMRNLSASRIAINRDAARRLGLTVPPAALKMETPGRSSPPAASGSPEKNRPRPPSPARF